MTDYCITHIDTREKKALGKKDKKNVKKADPKHPPFTKAIHPPSPGVNADAVATQ